MRNLDQIKEKITKLLNLSEGVGASQGEIDNAIAAATRLMTQHNLSREDIDFGDPDNPTRNVRVGQCCAVSKTYTIKLWEHLLIDFVKTFIGFVDAYTTGPKPLRKNGIAILDEKGNQRKGFLIWFYGSADDCESAVELFEELRETIAIMAVTRWGSWSRGDGAVYAEGFCAGLERARKKAIQSYQNADAQTRALVVQDQNNQLAVKRNATKWLADTQNVFLRKRRLSGGASGSHEARQHGLNDGLNYGPSRPNPRAKLA